MLVGGNYNTMNVGYAYTRDGSYSQYNSVDENHFNDIIRSFCGENCISPEYNEESIHWGNNPMIEKNIIQMDNTNKEWMVDHWIYANNFYKVNLIIILFEYLYKIKKDNDIPTVALDFLLYNSCSGSIEYSKQAISLNFFNMARTLREHPMITDFLDKIKKASENRIDEICINETYTGTDYGKVYNGGISILFDYYSKYSQNGGRNTNLELNKLRNEINMIKYN